MKKLQDYCSEFIVPQRDKPKEFGGDIPWCRIEDIEGKYLNGTKSGQFVTEDTIKKMNLKVIPEGAVICSCSASIGVQAILTTPCITNQTFIGMVPRDELSKEFLYYFLKSKSNYLKKIGTGTTIPYISRKKFEELSIPEVSLDEQSKIVNILEKAETILEERKREIQLLDELIKARFVELFGDLAAPNCEWKKEKLVDTCKNPDDIKCGPFGTQLSKEEYQYEGIAVWEIPQINSRFTSIPTHFLTEEKAKQLDAYSLKPGDIAMSRKGNVGKCAVFPSNFEVGIIHSDVLRIRVDNNRVLPIFMMHQLHNSGAVQHQIELVSTGAIMAGINVTKLKQIFVHVPPMELQKQFVAFVEQIDKSKLNKIAARWPAKVMAQFFFY